MNPQNNLISTEIKNFNQTLAFVGSVSAKHQEEQEKLPYHINILDLIKANENAHSRIFSELLKQKSNGKYEILDSFTDYLNGLKNNFPKSILSPKITAEKQRIDILISGKASVFIIENKVHDATDQPAQLARYINQVISKEGTNKELFVLYLTKDGTKKPNPDTWNLNGEDYYKTYETKFFEINFRYDILPWLKNHVLPNVKLKDVFLKSTVEQYIDYLEGWFNQRTIHKNMNEELKKHIEKSLELGDSLEKNIEILEKISKELDQVKNQVVSMINGTRQSMWSVWFNQLERDFSHLELLPKSFLNENTKFIKVGVKLKHEGCEFAISLESNGNSLYYGLGRHSSSQTMLEPVKILSQTILKGYRDDNQNWWYAWQYTNYSDAYSELSSLIKQIESYIAENSNK